MSTWFCNLVVFLLAVAVVVSKAELLFACLRLWSTCDAGDELKVSTVVVVYMLSISILSSSFTHSDAIFLD
jgi:hypothetical protein